MIGEWLASRKRLARKGIAAVAETIGFESKAETVADWFRPRCINTECDEPISRKTRVCPRCQTPQPAGWLR